MRRMILNVAAGLVVLGVGQSAFGYIEAAYSLGKIVQDSTNIVLMKVVSVDRDKNIIIYKKLEDVKGKHGADEIKQNIAHAGFNPREWQNVMAWAQEGKIAVFCHNGGASETCIDNYWFQCYARKGTESGGVAVWWDMYHGEPFLLRSYAGKPEKLAAAMKEMLTGAEVTVPCMVDGDKNAIALRTARTQRMRASMKLQDYNAARDFAGWGGDEIRPVLDMAGFEQISALPRMEGQSGFGVATGHLEGADKTDLVLYSEGRVAVMANAGEGSFDELDLPGQKAGDATFGGARAAAMADYNSSGKGSILLATPTGPRLLAGLGGGKLRDDSAAFGKRAYWGVTSCAWLNMEGEKDRPAVLLADEFAGLRLYRNKSVGMPAATTAPAAPAAAAAPPVTAAPVMAPGPAAFEDVSDVLGLGEKGCGAGMKVSQMLVADFDGDGKQDVLVIAADGRAVLILQSGGKFVEVKTGLSFAPGSRAVAADLDGDGKVDVAAVTPTGTRLYRNEGGARFSDVTKMAGMAGVGGTSVVALPRNDGPNVVMDLVVGCVGGSNRMFKREGPKGAYREVTGETGLDRRIFNSRALAVLPVAKGRTTAGDLVMVNEGQNSAILIWKK